MPPRKKLLEQPSTTQRPRTRAFVRAEAEKEKQRAAPRIPKPKDFSKKRPREVEEGATRETGARRQSSRRDLKQDAPKPALKRQPKRIESRREVVADNPRAKVETTAAKPKGKVSAKTKREAGPISVIDQTVGVRNQTESVSIWLRRVDPARQGSIGQDRPSPRLSEAFSESYDLRGSMPGSQQRQPSAVPSTVPPSSNAPSSNAPSSNAPTSNARSKNNDNKVTVEKLQDRCIDLEPESEKKVWQDKHQYLKQAVLPEVTKSQLSKMKEAIQKSMAQLEDPQPGNVLQIVETLRYDLDAVLSSHGQSVPLEIYFNSMIQKCRISNEAVLQRSVMVNVFHHYWFEDYFDWNAEGMWLRNDFTRMPTIIKDLKDAISAPKPDLIIGFRLKNFEKVFGRLYHISSKLVNAMKPDGGKQRCFPFLIMEVKRSTDSLEDAEMKNLHTASQALYNMHLWNVEAGGEDEFYEKVRVFTLVFNAGQLGVRVHRIDLSADKQIIFSFDELHPLNSYTRDSVCHMINAILYKYALDELLPALKATFKKVAKPGPQRPAPLSSIPENGETQPTGSIENLEVESDPKKQRVHDPKRKPTEADEGARPKRARKPQETCHTGVSGNFEQTSIDSQ